MIPREVTNTENIVDSRDLIAWRDWLLIGHENECPDGCNHANAENPDDPDLPTDCPDGCALGAECEHTDGYCGDPDRHAEADALTAVIDQIDHAEQGQILIRETHFTAYAQDYAEEIGDIDPNSDRWPYTCIDWEQAARELRQDFTSVDWDGVTYYYRA